MTGNLLTSDIFSRDSIAKLSEIAINPGVNFLGGMITSTFLYDAQDREMQKNLTNLQQGVLGTGSFVWESVDTLSQIGASAGHTIAAANLAPQILAEATAYMTNTIVSYSIEVATAWSTIYGGVPSYMVERVAYWTQVSIQSPKDILDELNGKAFDVDRTENINNKIIAPKSYTDVFYESIAELKQQQIQSKAQSKSMEKFNDAAAKFAEFNDKVRDGLTKYEGWLQEGPAWLDEQIKGFFGRVEKTMREEIGESYKEARDSIFEACDKGSRFVGETLVAGPINWALRKTLKKLVDDAKTEIERVNAKNYSNKLKLTMKLKALFGV